MRRTPISASRRIGFGAQATSLHCQFCGEQMLKVARPGLVKFDLFTGARLWFWACLTHKCVGHCETLAGHRFDWIGRCAQCGLWSVDVPKWAAACAAAISAGMLFL